MGDSAFSLARPDPSQPRLVPPWQRCHALSLKEPFVKHQRLSRRDREIIALHAKSTYTAAEIAQRVGVATSSVYYTLSKPLAKAELARIYQDGLPLDDLPSTDLKATTEASALVALKTLSNLALHASNDDIKLRAATAILDRTADIESIIAHIPKISNTEWRLIKALSEVGYGDGCTLVEAFTRLDDATTSSREQPEREESAAAD